MDVGRILTKMQGCFEASLGAVPIKSQKLQEERTMRIYDVQNYKIRFCKGICTTLSSHTSMANQRPVQRRYRASLSHAEQGGATQIPTKAHADAVT
jgi:hypothetical protein